MRAGGRAGGGGGGGVVVVVVVVAREGEGLEPAPLRGAVVELAPRAACAGEKDTKHGDGEMKNG